MLSAGAMRPALRTNASMLLIKGAPRSPTCLSPKSRAASQIARLQEALSPTTSDVALADAVDDYLKLSTSEQQACWAHMQKRCSDAWPRQVHALSQRVAVASPRALDWFASVRTLCAESSAGRSTWARHVDSVMASSVRPLYGACFLRLQQLRSPSSRAGAPSLDADAVQDPVMQMIPGEVQSAVLAQVKAGETVHRTESDTAFAAKFGPRRTVHSLLHTADPRQLLAVLYTAHLTAMPASMDDIDSASGGVPGPQGWWNPRLEPGMSPTAGLTTAAFYSVSSHAAVARGLRLGTAIIYRTAGYLAKVNPELRTFVTLSPIPEFCAWLQRCTAEDGADVAAQLEPMLHAVDITPAVLSDHAQKAGMQVHGETGLKVLSSILSDVQWWHAGPELRRVVVTATAPLVRAYMLTPSTAKSGPLSGGAPQCRVAAFHLGNGARMLRICAGADPSPAGLTRSAGFNVNYCYSTEGEPGLRWTMREGAAAYAAGPGDVLAAQNPELVMAKVLR